MLGLMQKQQQIQKMFTNLQNKYKYGLFKISNMAKKSNG
jgi:hypothetical protein